MSPSEIIRRENKLIYIKKIKLKPAIYHSAMHTCTQTSPFIEIFLYRAVYFKENRQVLKGIKRKPVSTLTQKASTYWVVLVMFKLSP